MARDENNGNNKIEVLKIEHCRIKGDLNIWNPDAGRKNLKTFKENGLEYIQLPNITLSFSSTVFEGKVSFKCIRFRGITRFTGARFEKSAEFDNAQFGEKANFTGVRFRGEADFMGVRFGGQTNFMGARFREKADFVEGTQFSIIANFRKAQFGKKAIFIRAQFRGVTDFGEARFGKETDFAMTQFGKETHFDSVQFGRSTNFNGARFEVPANFTNVKYWSDFVRVTWARWLWKDKLFSIDLKFQNSLDNCSSILDSDAWELYNKEFKNNGILFSDATTISIDKTDSKWLIIDTENNKTYRVKKEKEKLNVYGDSSRNKKIRKVLLLPENSPIDEPPEPAQFKLDSQNIDEVTNPHFKRYVADQQYIRSFQENHPVIYRLWRRTSNCGRSLSLWAFWCLLIALFFGCAYAHQYLISGAFLAISGICLLDDFKGKKKWIFLSAGLIWLVTGIFSALGFKIKSIGFKDEILLLLLLLSLYFQIWYCVWRWSSNRGRSIKSRALILTPLAIAVILLTLAYILPLNWMPNWWYNFWQEPKFEQTAKAYSNEPWNFGSAFYFSIVTFTTLGFGDVVAANLFARFLVTLEVILGYVMLGGLISIFANKLARRS